jgi:hypothetical protein
MVGALNLCGLLIYFVTFVFFLDEKKVFRMNQLVSIIDDLAQQDWYASGW